MSTLVSSIHTEVGGSRQYKEVTKRNKGIQTVKEKAALSLFENNIILYTENPTKSFIKPQSNNN